MSTNRRRILAAGLCGAGAFVAPGWRLGAQNGRTVTNGADPLRIQDGRPGVVA